MIEYRLSSTWFQRLHDRRVTVIWVSAMAGAMLVGLFAGALAVADRIFALGALVVVLVPVVAWRRLDVAVLGLGLLGLTVEQFGIGAPADDLTQRLLLFTSLSDGFKLSGIYVNPMEVLLGLVLVVVIARAGQRDFHLPRSWTAAAMALLVAIVVLGLLHGIVSGGDYKRALWEIRPFLYVPLMFLLVLQLPKRLETVTAFLWVFVIGVSFKALQGMLLMPSYLASKPRPDYLLTHEDSVWFTAFFALVALLWLFALKGRLRAVATAMLPFVFIVNAANNRRAAWLMVLLMIPLLLLVAWIRLPRRRRAVVGAVVGLAVFSSVYFPLYWNSNGTLGQPARAVRSAVAPDPRDLSSDLYRQLEDQNMYQNIKASPILGSGFGIRINYAIPIPNLSSIDSSIDYIPHNGALYLFYRLGIFGALAFWSMVGFAWVTACRLVRARDPRLALFGVFAMCSMLAYVVQGYLDLGFAFFRPAIFIGCVLGVLEVARLVQARQEAEAPQLATTPAPQPAAVGGGAGVRGLRPRGQVG